MTFKTTYRRIHSLEILDVPENAHGQVVKLTVNLQVLHVNFNGCTCNFTYVNACYRFICIFTGHL